MSTKPRGMARDTYAGGQEGQLLPLSSSMGGPGGPGGPGGARISLHSELFPSILSSHRAFSGIADSLVHKHFSESKPPSSLTPKITFLLLGDQHNKHCSSGKSLKTKIYPCGGTIIYIGMRRYHWV